MKDDLYKSCRWCKWHEKGKCTNERAFESNSVNVHPFIEDGVLSEAIKEGIGSSKIKLSDEQEINLVEIIDEQVSKALVNFDFSNGSDGVTIVDSSEFCCKYFL